MSQPKGSNGLPGSAGEAVATPTPPLPAHDDEITQIAPASVLAGMPTPSRSSGGFGSTAHPPTTPLSRSDGRPAPDVDASLPGAQAHVPETLPGHVQSGAPEARQVGRYLIRERLGRGGMATVFKAHDPGIGRDVAIKFLHATLCEDEEYRGRFLR